METRLAEAVWTKRAHEEAIESMYGICILFVKFIKFKIIHWENFLQVGAFQLKKYSLNFFKKAK